MEIVFCGFSLGRSPPFLPPVLPSFLPPFSCVSLPTCVYTLPRQHITTTITTTQSVRVIEPSLRAQLLIISPLRVHMQHCTGPNRALVLYCQIHTLHHLCLPEGYFLERATLDAFVCAVLALAANSRAKARDIHDNGENVSTSTSASASPHRLLFEKMGVLPEDRRRSLLQALDDHDELFGYRLLEEGAHTWSTTVALAGSSGSSRWFIVDLVLSSLF